MEIEDLEKDDSLRNTRYLGRKPFPERILRLSPCPRGFCSNKHPLIL